MSDVGGAWFYAEGGQSLGPFSAEELRRRLASGKIAAETPVWRAGMAGWQPARDVPELASALAATGPLQPLEVGLTVGLGVLTLGVYALVKFYQVVRAYQRLAPARRSHFETFFWAYLGTAAAALILFGAGVGVFLGVACFVLSILVLNEALEARRELLRSRALRLELTSDSTHRVLWILGNLLAVFLVGIALLAMQAWKFFSDHNAMATALAQASAPPPPDAPGQPPAAPPAPPS